jgi:membrane associated rhomboid family serine protease
VPLPYASDSGPNSRPTATVILIALNIVLTVGLVVGDSGGHWHGVDVLARFGIVPGNFHPYTVLTYSFFHAGVAHLLLNLFYLWLFGAGVEAAIGAWRFVLLYLVSGAVGGGLQAAITIRLLNPADGMIPIVGASAACAGLIGIYAVRYYRAHLSFVLVPFRPHVVTVVALFLTYEFGSGLWGLVQGGEALSVAHWAHIGGFIFGLSCAQWMRLSDVGQRAYLTADATQAMHNSVPGAAIDRWERVLAREPHNAQARVEVARGWLLLGDTDQAMEQYLLGMTTLLGRNERVQAAQVYAEIVEQGLEPTALTPWQLYTLGSTLEDIEKFVPASDALHRVALRYPDSAEAENALLKLISLYVHRLNRRAEAQTLLLMHMERYPHSQWRGLAEDLRRANGG